MPKVVSTRGRVWGRGGLIFGAPYYEGIAQGKALA